MSVDRTKVLEAAQKHLGKGNYDKAIAELRKIVAAEPADVRTWLKIGDLYTRKGSRNEAIETYARVATHYGDQGFFLKAVAVYKQILKLDPHRLEIQLKLAEMYEMLQLVSDALSTYEQVAASYARGGDIDKALSTLQKMTELDPENIPIRIKCAEGLSKAGRAKEAAVEFEAGARLLKEQGRLDDYAKVAERLLFHRPGNVETARELASIYLERGDPKRALAKLQLCFKADPKDIATLELLAEAFNQLGQLPKTISVYKEVARIHQEAKRDDQRARILRRILELDPGDREARQALAAYAEAEPAEVEDDFDEPEIVTSSEEIDLDVDDDEEEYDVEDMEILDDDEIVVMDDDEEEEAPAPAAKPSVPPEVRREAKIARLLTECDVFMRYGLKAKVIEQLKSVLEVDPSHVEARERLKDAYLDGGSVDAAIGELFTLAELMPGATARLYLRQILELDPDNTVAQERLAAAGATIPPPAAVPEVVEVEVAPPVEAAPVEAAEEEDDDEVFFVDDEVGEEPSDATVAEPGPSTAIDGAAFPDSEKPALLAAIPPPASAQALADPLAPMSPEEFDDVPLRPSTPGEIMAEVSQRLSMPPGEVEELLDEADFFIAQGLMDEARASLQDALASYPQHPLIRDKLAEVEQISKEVSVAPSQSQDFDLDQSFEFAEKLAEEFDEVEDLDAGSDVLDVEQVFAQFKKGVQAQVGAEDTETHFDLGIAYKEMGLLDDAAAEFALCLSNPARICISETMIGLCHVEKGDVSVAIGHFKKGLYADQKTDREELGLYFELGNAYDLLHDPKEALYYYQKVQKRDPGFRDVVSRIDALTRPQAPEAAGPAIQDDIDRAFDDLMGED